MAGGRLTVDRSLILEAGNGAIRSEAGGNSLLAAGSLPRTDAGLDRLQLGAQQIELNDIQLTSGQPGQRGAIDLQAIDALQLQRSILEGKQLFLRAGTVSVTENSRLLAPKGLIRLESLDPAQPLSVVNSSLDVGVYTLEDLVSPITSVVFDSGATLIKPDPDPLIGLFSKGDILVDGSSLNASQILTPLMEQNPALPRSAIQLTDTSGTVVLAADGGIEFGSSVARADASHNLAGNVAFQSKGLGGLNVSNSLLSASGGAGSGDLRLSSTAGIDLINSQLIAESNHFPAGSEGRNGWETISNFAGGEITLLNSSTDRGIAIRGSTLNAPYHTSAGPLENRTFVNSQENGPIVRFTDRTDGTDNAVDGDTGFTVLGGKIRLISQAGIHVTDRSTLYVDSSPSLGGQLESFGGSIQILTLSNDSQKGVTIDQESTLTARTGGTLFNTAKDLRNDFFFGRGGRIDLYSNSSIALTNATLDVSSSNTITPDLGYPFQPDPFGFQGAIRADSRGPQTISNTRFNISGDQATLAPAGHVSLTGLGAINTINSSITTGRTASALDPAATGSITLRSAAALSDVSGLLQTPGGSLQISIGSPQEVGGEIQAGFDERRYALQEVQGGIQVDGGRAIDTVLDGTEGLVNKSRETGLVNGYTIVIEPGGGTNNPIIVDRPEQKITLITTTPDEKRTSTSITSASSNTPASLNPVDFPWEPPPRDWWFPPAPFTAVPPVVQPPLGGGAITMNMPTPEGAGGSLSEGAKLVAVRMPIPSQGPSPPPLNTVRLLSFPEGADSFERGESLALKTTIQALGLEAGENTVVPSVARLQENLRASEADRRHQALPPLGMEGGPGTPYSPAILRFNAWPLPTGEVLIDVVLIPPHGPLLGWQHRVNQQALHQLIGNVQRQFSRMESLDQAGQTPDGRQLASLLLADVLPVLEKERITSVLLSADRKLQAIPFAALPLTETSFFGQRFALTITPSLGLTDLSTPSPDPGDAPRRILLAGASFFRSGLVPLPLVKQELGEISTGELSDLLLDDAFNGAELRARINNTNYSQIHIATHAELSSGPAGLGILHTTNGTLKLASFQGGKRTPNRLDLVSLSACRTALGDERSELGLLGAALTFGGHSGLGTLWSVDDVGNAAFFVQFYRYLQRGMTKDVALQATRRAFQQGDIRVSGSDLIGPGGHVLIRDLSRSDQARFSQGLTHPYYWAGALLTGRPW
ncbi:CHAT domain-containing protein [Cyanobium sp. ULC084]|nr:CHAT domain-containing protein [Synechococcus sp. CS-1326]